PCSGRGNAGETEAGFDGRVRRRPFEWKADCHAAEVRTLAAPATRGGRTLEEKQMKRRTFISLVASAVAAPGMVLAAAPKVTVHKDPNCGCCAAWASAFGRAGYDVRTVNEADMDAVKNGLKVPSDLWGCHTAEV